VGAGPISSKLSKLFIRWSLFFSDYTSFRDEASKQLIRSIGFHGEGYVYPDLAHSLFMDGKKIDHHFNFISIERPLVGINPMPLYDSRYWCVEDSSKYNDYVRKLARFSSTLMREGYPIFFFGTQLKDESVARDVFENLDPDLIDSLKIEELLMRSRSVSGLMKLLSSADIIVATRFHGTILSLIAGIPVLAICYYRKTKDIMKEMDQENYSVPFEKLEVPDMIMRFKILETNRVHEAKKIYKKNEEYRNLLKEQYDLLFGSVRSSSDEHQISSMTFV
jgi:polysaccharide pyruvyl transferase WcaK-like protein